MTMPDDGGRTPPNESGPADLEPDVERLHRAILREPRDPEEGHERVPRWLWTGAVLAIFWGGWYLGRFGGTFGAATHVAFGAPGQAATGAAASAGASTAADPIAAGKLVFATNCAACHQASGRGMPGAFPPLVGSEWVIGSPDVLAHILLNGLQGPVAVAGSTYNGAMPAWRDQLKDEEIAAVLTYVRQWAPNHAAALSPALVAATRVATASRTTAWTATELRDGATAPPTVVPTPATVPAARQP